MEMKMTPPPITPEVYQIMKKRYPFINLQKAKEFFECGFYHKECMKNGGRHYFCNEILFKCIPYTRKEHKYFPFSNFNSWGMTSLNLNMFGKGTHTRGLLQYCLSESNKIQLKVSKQKSKQNCHVQYNSMVDDFISRFG